METRTIILLIFGIAAFASILLYLAERASISLLGSFLFRVGIPLKTFQGVDINLDPFSIGRMYEATHAKLKRVSEDSCFYSYRVVGYYELYTPFPIKGEVVHQGGETLLIWRIPIGSTLFLAVCILGLFQLTISRVILNDLVSSLPLFLVGLLGVCALVLFSIQLEQKRARLALFELTSFSLPK